ncbi:N-acetylneuraminate synthase family protein, partial [bacterium]|nr:N-acetylneuraminate synthase family protein [bacterium]
GKPLICSTGMATENEIRQGITLLKSLNVPYILLHCNSTYPAPFKDINLVYMNHIKELGNCLVGYSGHERGIAIAISAVALGAKVIEKHLTLDKSWEGNDHKISLLPEEFQQMVEGIREIELALDIESDERQLSQGEMMNREVLAKSLVAATDISSGTIISKDMIEIKSPGQGLQPNRMDDLIGRVILRDIIKNDFFFPSDLGEEQIKARNYHFDRKWGIPVRYHDLQKMKAMSNLDLLEIHLSYKDMELDFKAFIPEPINYDLLVHAPELFAGDHTLDLCSTKPEYRRRSIKELQRVIDLTRQLKPFFLKAIKPVIVTNVGGFSNDRHLDQKQRKVLYGLLEESLLQLDTDGVELIPQTMPPFPWHFGGHQYHNLFMGAQDIKQFCEKHAMRICLDVSHTQLACSQYHWSLSDFIKQTGQFIAHLHLADAKGVDGEGLQIGEGDIDWVSLFTVLRKYSPEVTFIPEIWQGHKNNGEQAWLAMAALEKYNQLSLE